MTGVTCFVLKHRLARETNSPYSLNPSEAGRAASHARHPQPGREWNLDTNRIGALGFSAGGEVVALLVYSPTAGDPNAGDAIDRMNCRTDFQISIYPGPLGVPTGEIPADAPPAFFLVANDDNSHVGPVLAQLEKISRGEATGGSSSLCQRWSRFQFGQSRQARFDQTQPQR